MNRHERLLLIRQSRQATENLVTLMSSAPFNEEKIQENLDQGALVSEAIVERQNNDRRKEMVKHWVVDLALREGSLALFSSLVLAAAEEKAKKKLKETLRKVIFDNNPEALDVYVKHQILPKNEEFRVELMHLAIWNDKVEIAKILLEQGFPATATTKDSWCEYSIFGDCSSVEMASLLMKHGARLDTLDDRNYLPVYHMIGRLTHNQEMKDKWGEKEEDFIIQMIEQGSALYTTPTEERPHDFWNILKQIEMTKIHAPNLIRVVYGREPQLLDGLRFKSLESAKAFWEAGIFDDKDAFEARLKWQEFPISNYSYKPEKLKELEDFLCLGFKHPDITTVEPAYISEWLKFGITSTQEDIDRIVYESEGYDADEQMEYSRYRTDWAEDLELIQDSHHRATIRAERNQLQKQTPAVDRKKSGLRL